MAGQETCLRHIQILGFSSALKRKEEKLLKGSSKVVTINSKLAKVINCDESKIEIISNSFRHDE